MPVSDFCQLVLLKNRQDNYLLSILFGLKPQYHMLLNKITDQNHLKTYRNSVKTDDIGTPWCM